jgi:hypothetical protein
VTVALVGMVRDELDVIEGWIRHHADEVDYLLIADNGSTDGTRDVLTRLAREFRGRLIVQDDPEPAYFQSRKMSALAARAADRFGATWILPADADEIWYARTDRIRVALADLPWNVVKVPIYNHICTALDEPGDDPFRTMVWRQAQAQKPLGKVAFRYQPGAVVWQGNHGVDLPDPGPLGMLTDPLLEIRHLPVRGPKHMVRKARNGKAAYDAARAADPDMPADWGLHWTQWGQILEAHGEEMLMDGFRQHWWHRLPYLAGLVRDPAPYRRWEIPGTG